MDYLARDSFYSGVAEGKIGSERIIKMLAVKDDRLVVEEKGIYSIEKFLMARRLMYWQVYLHRTVLCAEFMLMRVLKRAKALALSGVDVFTTPALSIFINESLDRAKFIADPEILNRFCELDDSDITCALKVWQHHDDPILSELSKRIVHRNLFQIELRSQPFSNDEVETTIQNVATGLGLSREDATQFVINDTIHNSLYSEEGISIQFKNGTVQDFAEASDQLNREILTRTVSKSFLCYPKELAR